MDTAEKIKRVSPQVGKASRLYGVSEDEIRKQMTDMLDKGTALTGLQALNMVKNTMRRRVVSSGQNLVGWVAGIRLSEREGYKAWTANVLQPSGTFERLVYEETDLGLSRWDSIDAKNLDRVRIVREDGSAYEQYVANDKSMVTVVAKDQMPPQFTSAKEFLEEPGFADRVVIHGEINEVESIFPPYVEGVKSKRLPMITDSGLVNLRIFINDIRSGEDVQITLRGKDEDAGGADWLAQLAELCGVGQDVLLGFKGRDDTFLKVREMLKGMQVIAYGKGGAYVRPDKDITKWMYLGEDGYIAPSL